MIRPQLRGGKWRIRWFDHTGARISETWPTKKAAEASLRRHEVEAAEIQAGLRPPPSSGVTFKELAALWVRQKKHKRSLYDDKIRIEKIAPLVPKSISAIDEVVIDSLRAKLLEQGSATQTVRNYLALLRGMLRLAVRHKLLSKCPHFEMPRPEQQQFSYLLKDEIKGFLAAARAENYFGLAAMYATAVYTGLRRGELAALTWSDVNLKRREIMVSKSLDGPTKSGKSRVVPILNPLFPVLVEHQKRARSMGQQVFPSETGKRLTKMSHVWRSIFRRVLTRAEINRIRFHDLRHTFAAQWVMAGGGIYELKKILGHSTINVTERYAHLAPGIFKSRWGLLD